MTLSEIIRVGCYLGLGSHLQRWFTCQWLCLFWEFYQWLGTFVSETGCFVLAYPRPYTFSSDIWAMGCILYEHGAPGLRQCLSSTTLLVHVLTLERRSFLRSATRTCNSGAFFPRSLAQHYLYPFVALWARRTRPWCPSSVGFTVPSPVLANVLRSLLPSLGYAL